MLVPNTAANGDTTKAWDILIGDPLVATSLLPIGRGGATHMALVRGTGDSSWVIHWQHGDMARIWLAKDGETAVMSRNVPLLRDSMEAFCGSECLLPDGRLLAMGGTLTEGREIGTTGTNRTAVFDATKTLLANRGWAMRDTMTVERWYGTSTTLGDGRVLAASGKAYDYLAVFGGRQAGGLSQDLRLMRRGRHAIWETDDTQFPKSTAREGHSLSYVKAGDLYVVFGGLNNAGALVSTDSVSILQRDALDTGYLWKWNTFKPDQDDANGCPPRRAWHSSVVMGDSLFVFGGLGSSGALDDLWMLGGLHTSTPKWQKISIGVDPTNGPGPARYLHSGVLDLKRRQASAPIPLLVLFGGRTTVGGMAPNDVWAIQLPRKNGPTTARWERLLPSGSGNFPPAREGHVGVIDAIDRGGIPGEPKRIFIQGGSTESALLSDMWVLSRDDAKTADPVNVNWRWNAVSFSNTSGNPAPDGRWKHAAIHDTQWDDLRIFGGNRTVAAGGETNQQWRIGLGSDVVTQSLTWKAVNQQNPPAARSGFAMLEDDREVMARQFELFQPTTGQIGDWALMGDGAKKHMPYYPMMFVLRNGKVFFAGNGPDSPESDASLLLNVGTSTWTGSVSSTLKGGSAALTGSGRGPVPRDTVMKCGGGGNVHQFGSANGVTVFASVDSASGNAVWASGPLMPEDELRRYHNLTILPTGQVLMTGGLDDTPIGEFTTDIFHRNPRLWNPKTSSWAKQSDQNAQTGFPLAPDLRDRNYHSSALLLPDGRVLSASGDITPITPIIFPQATLYSPPYLELNNVGSQAVRPVIGSGCNVVAYGEAFTVAYSGVSAIDEVCIMRPGAMTHAFNMDQRRVELSFATEGSGALRVQLPGIRTCFRPGTIWCSCCARVCRRWRSGSGSRATRPRLPCSEA